MRQLRTNTNHCFIRFEFDKLQIHSEIDYQRFYNYLKTRSFQLSQKISMLRSQPKSLKNKNGGLISIDIHEIWDSGFSASSRAYNLYHHSRPRGILCTRYHLAWSIWSFGAIFFCNFLTVNLGKKSIQDIQDVYRILWYRLDDSLRRDHLFWSKKSHHKYRVAHPFMTFN